MNELLILIAFTTALILAIFDKINYFDNLTLRNKLGWVIFGANMAIICFISFMSFIDITKLLISLGKYIALEIRNKKQKIKRNKKILPESTKNNI